MLSLASISLLIATLLVHQRFEFLIQNIWISTLLVHQREDEHEQLGEACSATADCGDAEVIESTLMTFS